MSLKTTLRLLICGILYFETMDVTVSFTNVLPVSSPSCQMSTKWLLNHICCATFQLLWLPVETQKAVLKLDEVLMLWRTLHVAPCTCYAVWERQISYMWDVTPQTGAVMVDDGLTATETHWLQHSERRPVRLRTPAVCAQNERVSSFGFCSIFPSQACAHRWKNVYYDSEHILPHGYCSIIPPTLQGRTQPLIPCYEGTVEAPWWTSAGWTPFNPL